MKWVVRNDGSSWEVEVERGQNGLEVIVDGRRRIVDLEVLGGVASLRFVEDASSYHIAFASDRRRHWQVAVGLHDLSLDVLTPVEAVERAEAKDGQGSRRIEAPIPGKVVSLAVVVGDVVEVGQTVVILEAMKMENELLAEQAGKVQSVHVSEGATVEAGELLVELEQASQE